MQGEYISIQCVRCIKYYACTAREVLLSSHGKVGEGTDKRNHPLCHCSEPVIGCMKHSVEAYSKSQPGDLKSAFPSFDIEIACLDYGAQLKEANERFSIMNDPTAKYQDRCWQVLRFQLPRHLQFPMEIWKEGRLLSDEILSTKAIAIFQHIRGLMKSTNSPPEIFNLYIP